MGAGGRIHVGAAAEQVGDRLGGGGVLLTVAAVVARPVSTGASLAAVMSMVRVARVASRSTPLLAVPPLSWTWKVKWWAPVPLLLAAGA